MKLQVENNMFMQLLKGFSLIELMIVVAIIGILASIALPAYEGYIVKARMSHLYAIAADAKSKITEYRSVQGNWPDRLSKAYIYGGGDPYVLGVIGKSDGANYKIYITGRRIVLPDGNDPVVALLGTYTSGTVSSPAYISWECRVFTAGQEFSSTATVADAKSTISVMSSIVGDNYFTVDCPKAGDVAGW